MLPSQCQMFRVNADKCDKLVQGVVIMPGSTPMAAYKDGQGFCAQHTDALLKVNEGAYVMTAHAIETMQRTMTSTPASTPVAPPVSTAVTVDEVDEVDETDETDETDEADDTDELDEADDTDELDETEEVDEADAPAPPAPLTRVEQLAAQIAALEAELAAAREAEKARQWEHRVEQLCRDIATGGTTATAAFKAAMESGMLVLVNPDEKPRKVCAKTNGDASTGTTRTASADSPYTPEMVKRIRALHVSGHRKVDIAKVVGLTDKQIYYVIKFLKVNEAGQVITIK